MRAALSIRLLVAVLALAMGAFWSMPNHRAWVTMPVAAMTVNSHDGQRHAPQSNSSQTAPTPTCMSASCVAIPDTPARYVLLNVSVAGPWYASYRPGEGRLLIGPDPFPPKFSPTA